MFIAFQCTKERKKISSHFRITAFVCRLFTRNVGSRMLFSVFLFASENEFCFVAFALKMKSLLEFRIKGFFNMMGWRRCMRFSDCFPETCFESLNIFFLIFSIWWSATMSWAFREMFRAFLWWFCDVFNENSIKRLK